MAVAARAFFLSRLIDQSLCLIHHHHHHRPQPPLPSFSSNRRRSSGANVNCLSGGVSDDFVSTHKSSFDRGFSVIANLLKRIEPLDTSVISQGVSASARDSMKQTISTMLGLLPSYQFSVTVRVSKQPLDRLLASSIITGYTLWNAEYRISLTRNFDVSSDSSRNSNCSTEDEVSAVKCEESEERGCEVGLADVSLEDLGRNPQLLGDLPPEALNCIQQLQSELSLAEEELNARKQENMQVEHGRGNRNGLLEYLRSLDNDTVAELSRPSSVEVDEIIQQLVQNILQRFFQHHTTSGESVTGNLENNEDGADESSSSIGTSRDYLAKLLFWCMLLGHHLRGLENRLHLSCAVGLL